MRSSRLPSQSGRSAWIPGAGALLLSLGLACSVKAPPTREWSISSRSRAQPVTATPGKPSVGIRRFKSADDLRTTSLLSRAEDGRRLEAERLEHWASYPDRMLEDLAHAELRNSGDFSAVVVGGGLKDLDGLLACRVLDFSEWRGGSSEARVSLSCTVTHPRSGDVLSTFVSEASEASTGSSTSSVVAAYEAAAARAIANVATQTAAAVKNAGD